MAGQSRLDTSILPKLCTVEPRLQTLTELFCTWMKHHFGSVDTIEDPILNKLVWRPDVRNSGIVIEPHTVWEPRVTQFRPSIVVKRQSWKSLRVGIDNRLMGESSSDGNEHYTNYWQGAHTLFCICGEAGETERLATEVFREINQMGRIVQRYVGLFRLEVVEVAETARLKEAKEAFAVPINIAYVAEENWRLAKEAPFLKRINLSLSQ